jgi:pyruvate/2-oxoacid:ferredoxin oxidoreductase beta subunit
MEVYKTLAEIPQDEFFTGGHGGCRGCGAALAARQAMKALGPRTIVTIPASCMATIGGSGLSTAWEIPFYHSLFECAPAVASGIRAALDIQGIKDVNVVSWAGDAGTADIGFQSLTGAAERQENIIHVCYDNETYMNTGGQAGSVTPYQAVTPDTPAGKPTPRKDMLAIMAAHHPAYLATASVAYPLDLIRKFQKARAIQGFRYIHILAPCFRGWGIREDQTVQLARLAVECGLWQLYEEIGGRRRLTVVPERRIPVREYLRLQGRFKNMDEAAVEALQAEADRRFQEVQS